MSFLIPGVLKDMWVHWLYIGAIALINICLFSWFMLSVFDERVHYAGMIVIGLFMLIAGKYETNYGIETVIRHHLLRFC